MHFTQSILDINFAKQISLKSLFKQFHRGAALDSVRESIPHFRTEGGSIYISDIS